MFIPYRLKLLKWRMFRASEGETILRNAYKSIHGNDLNTENPKKFSEKLFILMIDINKRGDDTFTCLADKLLVREYVKKLIGSESLIEIIWHGKEPSKIPFDELPKNCILKTNHGSGGHILWEESLSRHDVISRLRNSLDTNYYWVAREYQYYKINPQIIVERIIDDGRSDGPLDYRFWCFHGRPELIQVDNRHHSINPFYDCDWNKLQLRYREDTCDCDIPRPKNLEKMIDIASILSADFDFVRVDLYNVDGHVYFGEMTFTPVAGRMKFEPRSWDEILGRKW